MAKVHKPQGRSPPPSTLPLTHRREIRFPPQSFGKRFARVFRHAKGFAVLPLSTAPGHIKRITPAVLLILWHFPSKPMFPTTPCSARAISVPLRMPKVSVETTEGSNDVWNMCMPPSFDPQERLTTTTYEYLGFFFVARKTQSCSQYFDSTAGGTISDREVTSKFHLGTACMHVYLHASRRCLPPRMLLPPAVDAAAAAAAAPCCDFLCARGYL